MIDKRSQSTKEIYTGRTIIGKVTDVNDSKPSTLNEDFVRCASNWKLNVGSNRDEPSRRLDATSMFYILVNDL